MNDDVYSLIIYMIIAIICSFISVIGCVIYNKRISRGYFDLPFTMYVSLLVGVAWPISIILAVIIPIMIRTYKWAEERF